MCYWLCLFSRSNHISRPWLWFVDLTYFAHLRPFLKIIPVMSLADQSKYHNLGRRGSGVFTSYAETGVWGQFQQCLVCQDHSRFCWSDTHRLWFTERNYRSDCPTLPLQYKGAAKVLWSPFTSWSYLYLGRSSDVLDQTAIHLFNITGFFHEKYMQCYIVINWEHISNKPTDNIFIWLNAVVKIRAWCSLRQFDQSIKGVNSWFLCCGMKLKSIVSE
jgi:hypothetical protein